MTGSLGAKPHYYVFYAATYRILRQVCALILLVGRLITVIPEIICKDKNFFILCKITLAWQQCLIITSHM